MRPSDQFDVLVSAPIGYGIDHVLKMIVDAASQSMGSPGDVLPSRLRHVALLKETAGHLQDALAGVNKGLELRADDLRRAANSLARISGAVDVEDLLDVIFSEFCVGK